MNRRYLIFISSTYEDLKEEREKVISAVLELKHIPSGMEQFPAVGIPPMNLIKKVLKDCDYYILIIGARYGSLSDNDISYTEEEYNFAISEGIPVIAFFPSDPNSFPISKLDDDHSKLKLLEAFKEKVRKGGITIKYWKNADDLKSKVLASIPQAIEFQPRIGWVRADVVESGINKKDFEKLKEEIGGLQTNNSQLKKKVSELEEINKRTKEENKRLENELINLRVAHTNKTNSTGDSSIVVNRHFDDDWETLYKVHANVKFSYAYSERNFNYSVEYSLKKWFAMIGVIIKNNDNRINENHLVSALSQKIYKDSYYRPLFKERAGKLIQKRPKSMPFRIVERLTETDLRIKSVTIEPDILLEYVIPHLFDKGCLDSIDSDYILTREGEEFLLESCL